MKTPLFPPKGCTDSHTHIALNRYPMTSPRAYTPANASAGDMRAMMDQTGIDRIVVVQMSVFGTDNTCMMDGIEQLGACARGVVQLDEGTSGAALDALHKQGARGIRVNLNTTGLNTPEQARKRLSVASEMCARHNWHLQLFTSAPVIAALTAELGNLPVPIVFDHFGLLPVLDRGGIAERTIRDLLAQGRGWVKISGTYRLDHPTEKAAISTLARDLYAENPRNIVWGSDWPHAPHHANIAQENPEPQPYRDIDPRKMLTTIAEWFDREDDRKAILVDNPARLYDF